VRVEGALQPLINPRVAHAYERVSTMSFVVSIREDSESNAVGAQGTFKSQ